MHITAKQHHSNPDMTELHFGDSLMAVVETQFFWGEAYTEDLKNGVPIGLEIIEEVHNGE